MANIITGILILCSIALLFLPEFSPAFYTLYALQDVNTQIFQEWLPGNPEYELYGNASVEWYDCVNGEKTDPDYHSAIWVPVRQK